MRTDLVRSGWQTPRVVLTSARLLRLLSLLQSRRHWSGADLTERLEITSRTLRRDIERLRSLGYPVRSAAGTEGGYQLGAGAELPPLLLDDDEALAVSVGLRGAVLGTVVGIEEAAVRALAKLEQVFPARLRSRVAALHAAITPLVSPAGPTVDPLALSTIASACRDSEQLRFDYQDRHGKPTHRTVEPNGLVYAGRSWYLVAWDVERQAWRSFRVDRMGKRLSPGPRVPKRSPPEGGLASYVARALSVGPYEFRAQIIVHAPLERLTKQVRPNFGLLQAVDPQTCLLETGAHSLDSLALQIALLGVDFEVQHPPELNIHIRQLAERLLRATQLARTSAPIG